MTRGFYGNSLLMVGGLLAVLDEASMELEDNGLAIEGVQLTNSSGEHYIGNIEFDEDKHPYFVPAD